MAQGDEDAALSELLDHTMVHGEQYLLIYRKADGKHAYSVTNIIPADLDRFIVESVPLLRQRLAQMGVSIATGKMWFVPNRKPQ